MATRKSAADPLATYNPSMGQYLLIFRSVDQIEGGQSWIMVYTIIPGSSGHWSRYLYPKYIDALTVLDDQIYLRCGYEVNVFDEDRTEDELSDHNYPIIGEVWWPFLDMDSPGRDKSLYGFDIVAEGAPFVYFGYDQAANMETSAMTDPLEVPADTVVDGIIAFPITAPSFSVRVRFQGGGWRLLAMNLYLEDRR